jgi:WD40 repeat protein/tRNA A-37 threonylcarbamoyl transferase component Bud32
LLRGAARSGPTAVIAEVDSLETNSKASPALGRLGDYELLEKIAEGGMGAVYKARQISLNRIVALKLILAGRLATEAEVRRFRTEAEAVAQLDHPNIVPIYEVGEEEGRHYFAMKFVEGGSLAARSSGFRVPSSGSAKAPSNSELGTRNSELAILVAKLARAVHHAHQRGVLHRDLKPANILVDAQGEPHVTDFGLARLAEQDSGLTLPGTVMGTPSFMAPEQAAGAARELTTAADVYGLGAVLYFLLSGRAPFEGATPAETLRRVLDEEPQRPTALVPGTDRDLETICLKCLEKDPLRRYPSALALAEDIERWQRHEPITARPMTTWELAAKWVRRRPAIAALVTVTTFSVFAFVTLQWRNQRRLEGERNRAVAQEEATRQNLYAADVYLAQQALGSGNLGLARRALEAHVPQFGQKDLRGFEWRYLWSLCRGDQVAILDGHKGSVGCVVFSPDGRKLASGGEDRFVRIWDIEARPVRQTLGPFGEAVVALAFSADGQRLTGGSANADLSAWNAESGKRVASWSAGEGRVILAPSTNLAAVALTIFPTTGRENIVKLFDALTGKAAGTLRHAGAGAAFAHDGRRLATARPAGFAIWDTSALTVVREQPEAGACSAFVFSRDDRQLASFAADGRSVRVWETDSARPVAEFAVAGTKLRGGDFSPDGRWLATCGTDQAIHFWDLEARRKVGELKGHENEVRAVTFSPDGQLLASAGKDGTVRLWNARLPKPESFPTNAFPPCALSADGLSLATQDRLGRRTNVEVIVWNVTTWEARRLPGVTNAQPIAFVNPPDGLLTMTRPFQAEPLWLRRFDLRSGRATEPVKLPNSDRPRTATDYCARRDQFALGSYDGQIILWSAADGSLLTTLSGPSNEVQAIRFAPDGRTLASFAKGGGLKLWTVDNGREIRTLSIPAAGALDLAFSPNGEILAVADTSNAIELWNAATGRLLTTLAGHAEPVLRLAFAPDGRTLASSSEDGAVKLWSVVARRELATLFRGEPKVWLEFSADGQALFATDTNGHLNCWRAPGLVP